jgi:hypothetical protein
MTKDDFAEFGAFWQDVHNSMSAGKTFTESTMQFVFEILEPYPLELIKQAVKQHARGEKFAPQPSDIINLLEMGNKRPLSDEAWSRVPKDNLTSEWLTIEMLAAWSGVCEMYQTDKVGARMAFKATYERLCAENVLQGKPIEWQFSAGDDKHERREKVLEGMRRGYITRERATALLPSHTTPTDFGRLLIGDFSQEAKTEKAKRNAQRAREIIAEMNEQELLERQQRERQRIEREQRQAEMIEAAQRLEKESLEAA